MLEKIKLENILFIDIETAPMVATFDDLDPRFQKMWEKKAVYLKKEDQTASEIFSRAAIYAEFGKIICISVGFILLKDGERHFRLKSFYNDDEKQLLIDFATMINAQKEDKLFCAHNGKEFDYPYIARRMLINGIKIPKMLDNSGKKTWEINHLDTLELWKFGDYKHYTSLELLTTIFDIPTPKDDIDGSEVAEVYWVQKDLKRIVAYCEKDVLAVAQLILRYKGDLLIDENNVEVITA